MVNNQEENQVSENKNAERPQNRPQKSDQQSRNRSRNQHTPNQPRAQGNYSGTSQSPREAQAHSTANPAQTRQSQPHQSQPRNANTAPRTGSERHEGHGRYYRDRSNDRIGTLRNRADETIDDIKEDIVRLEKEIDLEIKEIRSMKL